MGGGGGNSEQEEVVVAEGKKEVGQKGGAGQVGEGGGGRRSRGNGTRIASLCVPFRALFIILIENTPITPFSVSECVGSLSVL